MFNNNTAFGYFASNANFNTVYTGPTSQTIYRDFSTEELNSTNPNYRIGPDFKFLRLGQGSYYTSTSAIAYENTNVPRFDYGPDGVYRGLLIEETRANIIPYSTDFKQTGTWSVLTSTDGPGVTLLTSTQLAPDNISYATLLSANPVRGFRAINYNSGIYGTALSSTNYTRSIFIKKNIGRYAFLCISNPAEPTGFQGGATMRTFDFDTKQFVVFGDGGSLGNSYPLYPDFDMPVQVLPNDWIRIGVFDVPTNANKSKLTVGTAAASGWETTMYTPGQQDIGSFYIWGAQYERGLLPSSYIPTSGTQVSRPADSVTMTRITGYNPLQGSLFIKGSRPNVLSADNTYGAFVQGGDPDTYWELYGLTNGIEPSGQGIHFNYNTGTFNILQTVTPIADTSYTLVGAISTNLIDTRAYYAQDNTFVNEILAPGVIPTRRSATFRLGQRFNNYYLNGHIKELGYWPAYVPFSALSALI